jgi:hypothetical protein
MVGVIRIMYRGITDFDAPVENSLRGKFEELDRSSRRVRAASIRTSRYVNITDTDTANSHSLSDCMIS